MHWVSGIGPGERWTVHLNSQSEHPLNFTNEKFHEYRNSLLILHCSHCSTRHSTGEFIHFANIFNWIIYKRLKYMQNFCFLHAFQFIFLLTKTHIHFVYFQSFHFTRSIWNFFIIQSFPFVPGPSNFVNTNEIFTFPSGRPPTHYTGNVVSCVRLIFVFCVESSQHSMSDMTFIHSIASLINTDFK